MWAATWQNQQSDKVHPPSLIRVFAVRMKKSWVLSYSLSAQQRLWSDWADAEADLRLWWAQSLCWFCHVAAHFIYCPVYPSLDSAANNINNPRQCVPWKWKYSRRTKSIYRLIKMPVLHNFVRWANEVALRYEFYETNKTTVFEMSIVPSFDTLLCETAYRNPRILNVHNQPARRRHEIRCSNIALAIRDLILSSDTLWVYCKPYHNPRSDFWKPFQELLKRLINPLYSNIMH